MVSTGKTTTLDQSQRREKVLSSGTAAAFELDAFRAMLDAMPVPVWAGSADNLDHRANRAWLAYSGLSQDDVSNSGRRSVIHPDDLAAADAALARTIATGETSECEKRLRAADGTYRWFVSKIVPLRDSGGAIAHWLDTCVDIDDRKRAEDALRESEQRFRRVFEQSPLGKATAGSPDWRFREVNPALCHMLGYGAEELEGVSFLDIVHPEDRAACLQYAEALASGENEQFQVEERLIHKTGEALWVSINVAAIRDAAGKFVYSLGIIENIDERRRTREALRDNEQRLRLAIEATELGTWEIDLVGPETNWSDRYREMLGAAPDVPAAQENFYRFVHPDDVALVKAEQSRCLGPGGDGAYRIEYRTHALVHGGPRWIVSTGRVFYDDTGNARRVIGTSKDVTERRRGEQALLAVNQGLERQVEERARQLSASQARLNAFFENSVDSLVLYRLAPDGRYVFANINAACERAYGLPREAVIGRTIAEIFTAEESRAAVERLDACVRTGAPQHYVCHRKLARGARTLELDLVRVPDEFEGQDAFIVATARDITEREHLEETLRQSQRLEAIGQLTGGVAHDFNNLLTAIIGNIELASARAGHEPDLRLYFERALRSADRGARLTEQLLAFSRRQMLHPQCVSANAALRGMHDLIRGTTGETISVSFRLAEDLWPCQVDAGQLEAAVLNLLVNARDALPGGGNVAISTGNERVAASGPDELAPGDYVVISVRDSGIGMPSEVAAKAFEPFFTTKDIGQGSGLGLSMVYGFARQSGGIARLDSAPGAGTIVRIYLPRFEGETDSIREARTSDARPGHGHVLVVEDDEDVARTTADLVAAQGYRVSLAADGPSALALLGDNPDIDALLSDVIMPGGMTGADLADRACALRPAIKVILTSGYTADRLAAAAGARRFTFVAKPFRGAEIGRMLQQLLDTRRG